VFPPLEMDEHRAARQRFEAGIAEPGKQPADYAKKTGGRSPTANF
jgi:hypothetical protein